MPRPGGIHGSFFPAAHRILTARTHPHSSATERENVLRKETFRDVGIKRGSPPPSSKVPHAKPDLLIAVKRRSWSCGVAIAPSFFTVGI